MNVHFIKNSKKKLFIAKVVIEKKTINAKVKKKFSIIRKTAIPVKQ